MRNTWFSRKGALGLAVGLAVLLGSPGGANAQSALFSQIDDVVGVGLWYGWGTFAFDAAPDSATDEVKGYTEVLPSTLSGVGPALGISFGKWGINLGYTQFEADLNGVPADVNQTPGDLTDDPTVLVVRGTQLSLNALYQPVRWFYAGYGQDRGNLEFVQVDASGQAETRKLAYENPFYTIGFGVGFDPTKRRIAPVLAVFAKIPAKRGNFTGTTYGAGLGVFF